MMHPAAQAHEKPRVSGLALAPSQAQAEIVGIRGLEECLEH